MGLCVSHDRDDHRRRSHSSRSSATTSGTNARNKPLNRSSYRPKWKSDVPITENQLRRKREEYWDTALTTFFLFSAVQRKEPVISVPLLINIELAWKRPPAFEGRKEIWDALRGACYAIEQNDVNLAQSIINCANISLPHGTLLDCYDELGTRYQIPVYVFSPPTNLIEGEQSSINENESGASEIDLVATNLADRERDFSANHQRTTSKSSAGDTGHNPIVREIKKHRRKHKSNVDSESSSTPPSSATNQQAFDAEIPIKFRLSNGKEHRLYCKPNEKIRNIKRRLAMLEDGAINSQTQRLFFGGKLLRDRTAVCETRLQRNFVVQVILQDPAIPPNGAITTTGHLSTHTDRMSYSTPVELPHSSNLEQN